MFDSGSFSKTLKIARYTYQTEGVVHTKIWNHYLIDLNVFDLSVLDSDSEKLAFWINVYNGMTNYAVIHFQIKESMKEIDDLFRRRFFRVSGIDFSLDDVEHGVLRRNAREHLSIDDVRLRYQVSQLDYRIHFALNCGAQSCPAIAYYTEEGLETELEEATTSFVEQEFLVNDEEKVIRCSSLFAWYKEDFGEHFLNDPSYANYDITLKPYDWSV